MRKLIDADTLEDFIENRYTITWEADTYEGGIKDACVDILEFMNKQPTIDAVPVSELREVEKERDYWMDKAHSYEQTILRLTVSAGEVPVRHEKWIKTDESDEFYGRLYRCSSCNTFVIGDMDNYCPNCGAEMK